MRNVTHHMNKFQLKVGRNRRKLSRQAYKNLENNPQRDAKHHL